MVCFLDGAETLDKRFTYHGRFCAGDKHCCAFVLYQLPHDRRHYTAEVSGRENTCAAVCKTTVMSSVNDKLVVSLFQYFHGVRAGSVYVGIHFEWHTFGECHRKQNQGHGSWRRTVCKF